MLRIRWVDNTSFLQPYYSVVDSHCYYIKAIYAFESNEIVLVRCNIQSKKALVYVLFHEFLHYLFHHLKMPEKLDRVIDNMDFRLQDLNGRRIDRAWGIPRYKKPKEISKYSPKNT